MNINPERMVNLASLCQQVGITRESNQWLEVTQPMIDQFAEVTRDHQFIHVNPAQAATTSFGCTIAHGFLTLSLLPVFLEPLQLIPEGSQMCINYGLNRVRFPSAVKVNSRIKATTTMKAVDTSEPDRVKITWEIVVNVAGSEKPALIAESLILWLLTPTRCTLEEIV
ncbi:MaoC family dehydratase [Halioxenophilus sp. WMMB6]|uniref:MaoC family dehydratase n=1 Tax=Halioxenophilus sp. WMMB6 TaxID=3073815 RepID=UPI00295E42E4|nr:MaoC family dehydratase [Halioxenophilus sp. WMMB6]